MTNNIAKILILWLGRVHIFSNLWKVEVFIVYENQDL